MRPFFILFYLNSHGLDNHDGKRIGSYNSERTLNPYYSDPDNYPIIYFRYLKNFSFYLLRLKSLTISDSLWLKTED